MQKKWRKSLWVVGALFLGKMIAVAGVAEDLITLHLDAIGGEDVIRSLQSVRREGYNLFEERRIPLLVYSSEANLMRIEMDLGNAGKLIQGYDGETAWKVRIRNEQLIEEPLSPEEAKQLAHDAIFRSSLLDLRTEENKLEYLGEQVREEKRFYMVKVIESDGHQSVLEIDAETYQIIRQSSTEYLQGREVPSVITFSDFRPVAGVWLPHRIETLLDERLTVVTVYESIKANPGFTQALFQAPTDLVERGEHKGADEEKS